MSYEHVIQHQKVSSFPGKRDTMFAIHVRDVLEFILLDWRSIAVVGVARQILFFQNCQQGFPGALVEAVDMKEIRLVEPYHFAGRRVPN